MQVRVPLFCNALFPQMSRVIVESVVVEIVDVAVVVVVGFLFNLHRNPSAVADCVVREPQQLVITEKLLESECRC